MARHRTLCKLLLASTALAPLGLVAANANPQGPQVVGGAATVAGVNTPTVTVTQTTQNAAINWQTFNIGVGERTQFIQPNSSSIVLNRVTGGLGASQIYGTLTGNGQIFLINPSGVFIGNGATVNAAGFLATTHDISNADFMAGRYNFNTPGNPSASVVNQGTITAASGGFAALVAPGVRNTGTITATLGTVGLAAGNGFSLDLYGDRLITLGVNDSIAATVKDVSTGQPLQALISNEGKLKANGGRVELTAAATRKVVDSVINNTGVIEARSIGTRNGMIVLGAATSASKPAGAPAQTVKISGKLSVAGTKQGTTGGVIQVTGEAIQIANAKLDASGKVGGGTVLIGGDVGGGAGNAAVASILQARLQNYWVPTATKVSVDAASKIDASAKSGGNGGKVIVWSDVATNFYGAILARGGASFGDGGFVEVSGKQTLAFNGVVNTKAANGRWGTLLLDPGNLTIQASGLDSTTGSQNFSGDNANGTVLTVTTLEAALNSGSVVVSTGTGGSPTDGNIVVASSVTWGAGSSSNSLTLNAYGSIIVNSGVSLTNTGSGNLILRADSTGRGIGTVTLPTGAIDYRGSTGFVEIFYNPAGGYSNPTNYLPAVSVNTSVSKQVTAYMLVNSIADLTAIDLDTTTRAGIYALGRDVDGAGGVLNPISSFSGLFEGLNQTISNVTVNGPAALAVNGGTVRNLVLDHFTVGATADNQFVGVLAGQNFGTISNVTVSNATVTAGAYSGIIAGGLVGANMGWIYYSSADGTLSGNGAGDSAGIALGGLVGTNFNTIANSYADVTVSSGSQRVQTGGLVGYNGSSGVITDSAAEGDVTANAAVTPSVSCTIVTCQFTQAGGLVGSNQGLIVGTLTEDTSLTYASGDVHVGSNGTAGGLVGWNDGKIRNTFAFGDVTGDAGSFGSAKQGETTLGGLVGANEGKIKSSYAAGDVGAAGIGYLQAGGLVGWNAGSIKYGFATNNVTAGNNSVAGGLVGSSGPADLTCTECTGGIGFDNRGKISESIAIGSVTVGDASVAGGLVGLLSGKVKDGIAVTAVTGGGNSVLGGLAGAVGGDGKVIDSSAFGTVASTGSNSWVGGLVGLNGGVIDTSYALTAVQGTSNSILGGLVGFNIGLVKDSSVTGPGYLSGDGPNLDGPNLDGPNSDGPSLVGQSSVTALGSNNVLGGLVGANFGFVDPSTSNATVAGGGNNIVGGLVGANGTLLNPNSIVLPNSTFPVGTIVDSTATGAVSGGPGSTLGSQVGTNAPTSLPASPSVLSRCTDAICGFLQSFQLASGSVEQTTTVPNNPVPTTQITPPPAQPKTDSSGILIALTPPPPPGSPPGQGPAGAPAGFGPPPGPGALAPPPPLRPVAGPNGERFSSVPPQWENRFPVNEVVLQVSADISPAQIAALAQRLGLTVITSQTLGSIGRTAFRFRITNGRPVRDIIRLLEANKIVAIAQPNYRYRLSEDAAALSSAPATGHGDPSQYMMSKLNLESVHHLASGRGIIVALVDSEVDKKHTELAGAISKEFDAVGADEKAHPHGTAMAGAISARDRLMGVAPSARILAVRAFSDSQSSAEGTTFSIIKGIDWAVSQGARVINMSFAGPNDPSLQRALKNAHDKGVVLIAAAGNAGPKSPALYPAADPSVIAVTATDSDDKLFKMANRGNYVSVAAPGVEILAPAPDEAYQFSTGTSIATAHISGVVAMMLERDPTLTPDEVRGILETTAVDLGAKGRDPQFGWGLVSPDRALAAVDARKAKLSSGSPTPR